MNALINSCFVCKLSVSLITCVIAFLPKDAGVTLVIKRDIIINAKPILVHRVRKKSHVIFDYNSRISWSIFIIFIPLETEMITPRHV